jgi:hypothetical protein
MKTHRTAVTVHMKTCPAHAVDTHSPMYGIPVHRYQRINTDFKDSGLGYDAV